jgi:hypothetical protein
VSPQGPTTPHMATGGRALWELSTCAHSLSAWLWLWPESNAFGSLDGAEQPPNCQLGGQRLPSQGPVCSWSPDYVTPDYVLGHDLSSSSRATILDLQPRDQVHGCGDTWGQVFWSRVGGRKRRAGARTGAIQWAPRGPGAQVPTPPPPKSTTLSTLVGSAESDYVISSLWQPGHQSRSYL